MSLKRTEKITKEVLKRVSIVISNTYNIDKQDIIDHIKDIPDSLKCNYTLTKGKRKGQLCGVTLCPHHQDDHTEDEPTIRLDHNEDEKYDSDIAAAIEESIMYENINSIRRRRGLVPLYG